MSETGHTRRWILGAVAGLGAAGVAGCGLLDDDPAPPAPPDPLQPLLDEAFALAAAYDRAVVAQPGLAVRLTPLADDHRAHVAELARVIGRTPPSATAPAADAVASSADAGTPSASGADAGTSTAPAAQTIAALRAAERAAQKTAVAACEQAPAERAALVGSIAACRATHAEALR